MFVRNYDDTAYHIPFEHVLYKDPVWDFAYQRGLGYRSWAAMYGAGTDDTSPTVGEIRAKYAQIRLMRYITQYTKRNPSVFFGNITQF
jgi:hypothetical protein